jgi:hypothetical protein
MPKPVKSTKPKTATPRVELPAGVLAVIDLEQPITIGKMEVDHLNVRKAAGVAELIAVQIAYEKQGLILDGVQVIGHIQSMQILAMTTLIDCMCQLAPGTAAELDMTRDLWHAIKVITPFLSKYA